MSPVVVSALNACKEMSLCHLLPDRRMDVVSKNSDERGHEMAAKTSRGSACDVSRQPS
jgi:hypothetical protein